MDCNHMRVGDLRNKAFSINPKMVSDLEELWLTSDMSNSEFVDRIQAIIKYSGVYA